MQKRYHLTTFGCQMNEHDSERMKGMLESLGYREAPERAEADLILFNTCSIREAADSRFLSHLGEARALKRARPETVVGVGGCWAQSVKEEVFGRFPFVDVAFGPGQVHRLAEFLTSDSLTAQGYFEFEGFTGHLPAHRERSFQGWLQISVGCNCACSYCIVPSTRGREVSRPLQELLTEAQAMAADGVREVTLLGQNVNSYGRDLPSAPPAPGAPAGSRRERPSFAQLLRLLDGVDGIDRIRYTSPHPKDMREDVILAHAELASLCEHIHLPLQSGSSRILKAMRRTYDRERYMSRVGAHPRARAGRRSDHRHHRRFPGRERAGLRADAAGRGRGRLRQRVHVRLLPAQGHRGRRAAGRRRAAPRQGRADGQARRPRSAARPRAGPALRGAGGRGPGGRPLAQRSRPAARAHPPQQGRQLHRSRSAG